MNGFYTKKGGQRVQLSTLSDNELTVVRANLSARASALNREVDNLSAEIARRVNARYAEQRAAREAEQQQRKVGKKIAAMSSEGRKFKDA